MHPARLFFPVWPRWLEQRWGNSIGLACNQHSLSTHSRRALDIIPRLLQRRPTTRRPNLPPPRLSSRPASNSGRRHSSVPVCVVDKRWGIFKPDEKLQLSHCERLSVLGRLSPKSLKVRGVSVRMQQGFGSEMMKWYPAAHCVHLIRRPASAAKSRWPLLNVSQDLEWQN